MRFPSLPQRALLLISGGLFGSLASLPAAVITLTGDNGFGESWNTAADWSNNAVPTSGNDYVVGSSAGKQLRTPLTDNQTFAGGSLTLVSTGLLFTKMGGNFTVTIDNLVLDGGAIRNAGTNSGTAATHTIAGNSLTVLSDSSINVGSGGPNRNLVISSVLTGSANLLIVADAASGSNSSLTFTNAGNTFTGGINLGATGRLSIATLQFNYSFSTPLAFLNITDGGRLNLLNNLSFQSITVAGVSLSAGTYTYANLISQNAGWSTYFQNSLGTITVIPEPSSALLLTGGFIAVMIFRRRAS